MRRLISILLLTVSPAVVLADSRDKRERAEIVAMFDVLTSKLNLYSDDSGGVADLDCLFGRTWMFGWPASTGSSKARHQPRELMTLAEALDPKGLRGDLFCDLVDAKKQAQELADARQRRVTLTRWEFSYPAFSSDMKTGSVDYTFDALPFTPAGTKTLMFTGTIGRIVFRKRAGVWSYKKIVDGIAN